MPAKKTNEANEAVNPVDELLGEYLADRKKPLLDAFTNWEGDKQPIIESALRLLDSHTIEIKSRAAKLLVRAAKSDPQTCAFAIPQLTSLLSMTDISPHDKVIAWNAALALSYLSAVSTPDQTRKFLSKIFDMFQDDSIKSAANAIKSLGRIARRRPRIAKKITEQMIDAVHPDNQSFRKPKKQQILAGKLIYEFRKYGRGTPYESLMIKFTEQQQASPRVTTMSRARGFLKRNSPENLTPSR